MLTDATLKCLKPKEKIYKVADRDDMYVRVMLSGAISFRRARVSTTRTPRHAWNRAGRDIALEPGESLTGDGPIAAGDTARAGSSATRKSGLASPDESTSW